MKIYIAAPLSKRTQAKLLASTLMWEEFEITSTWLFLTAEEPEKSLKTVQNEQWVNYCVKNGELDLSDINSADVVVFIDDESTSGGLWVELGYSIASGKRILWATDKIPNVFAGLVSVSWKCHESSILNELLAYRASTTANPA